MIKREKFSACNSYIRQPNGNLIPRYYLDALYSTLVHLKPKFCFEIGTNLGNSARIFQEYFDKHMPDGLLVTCDIQHYVDLSDLKNVKQVLVYPHIVDLSQHYVKEENLYQDYKDVIAKDSSVDKNIELVKIDGGYDFVFLDGDHSAASVYKDLEISNTILKEDGRILFDDTEEEHHDSCQIFRNELKNVYQYYEFKDWDVAVGSALLWK